MHLKITTPKHWKILQGLKDESDLIRFVFYVHDARNCLEERFEINKDWIRETSYETLTLVQMKED